MSVQRDHERARIFCESEITGQRFAALRKLAAEHLQRFFFHHAGGGSEYIEIGDLKIRFADHENTSRWRDAPDVNIVGQDDLPEEQMRNVQRSVEYPELVKKSVLALHVGLSVPKLKKLLTPDCYESVVVDPENYPNTEYEFVRLRPALDQLAAAGIETRLPVAQETWSEEDYSGPFSSMS
jgi:hypothetical protein